MRLCAVRAVRAQRHTSRNTDTGNNTIRDAVYFVLYVFFYDSAKRSAAPPRTPSLRMSFRRLNPPGIDLGSRAMSVFSTSINTLL